MIMGSPREEKELMRRLLQIAHAKLIEQTNKVAPKMDIERSIEFVRRKILDLALENTSNPLSASSYLRDVLLIEVNANVVAHNHDQPDVRRQFALLLRQTAGLAVAAQSLVELSRYRGKKKPEAVFSDSLDRFIPTLLEPGRIDDGLSMQDPDVRRAVFDVLYRVLRAARMATSSLLETVIDPLTGKQIDGPQWRALDDSAAKRVAHATNRQLTRDGLVQRLTDLRRGKTPSKGKVSDDELSGTIYGIEWRRVATGIKSGSLTYEVFI